MERFCEGSSDVTVSRNILATSTHHARGAMDGSVHVMTEEPTLTAGRLACPATPSEARGRLGRRVAVARRDRDDPHHVSPSLRALGRHRGFTFTEVLFAVILLGAGFIMLAGIFPVAIRQAQTSVEQTTAAAVGKLAVELLRPLVSNGNLPVTGNEVRQLPVGLEQQVRRDRVLTQDRRTGWTALYRRRANTNYAEIIVLVARVRGGDQFVHLPFVTGADTGQPLVEGAFNWDNAGVSTVTLTSDDGAAVEDGYVVVAGPDGTNAAFVGNVYRLGFRQSGDTWFLQPGAWYDSSGTLSGKVFVFGRAGVPDGSTPDPYDAVPGSFAGASQAVGVYTTILPLR